MICSIIVESMKYLSLLSPGRRCQSNCLEDFDTSHLTIQVRRICLIDQFSYLGGVIDKFYELLKEFLGLERFSIAKPHIVLNML
jgi:hypothetical protein